MNEHKPTIVCLCGSTRFSSAFRATNLQETLAGKIVLTVGCDFKSDEALGLTPADKERVDGLHLRKIDLADEVFVLNVNSYIGASTAHEILYAIRHHKRVRFLEPLQMGLPNPYPNLYARLPDTSRPCEHCSETATWWQSDEGSFYCDRHMASVLLSNTSEVVV
ncbi:MAG TPA: hypothetical protein VEL31_16515 [Ktedonobacteraceae bacterium]|nr:hypothetical protein [Ktedonobacteraceae bacterium]